MRVKITSWAKFSSKPKFPTHVSIHVFVFLLFSVFRQTTTLYCCHEERGLNFLDSPCLAEVKVNKQFAKSQKNLYRKGKIKVPST